MSKDLGYVQGLGRPSPKLLSYYVVRAILLAPIGGLFLLLPNLFRYWTLHYSFNDEGLHARWGVVFRREVNLTYARIQDIHLSSGILQRYFGLANLQVQTASGSAMPELVIEGFSEFEDIQDFIYSKMAELEEPDASAGGALELLASIRDELRAMNAKSDGPGHV